MKTDRLQLVKNILLAANERRSSWSKYIALRNTECDGDVLHAAWRSFMRLQEIEDRALVDLADHDGVWENRIGN